MNKVTIRDRALFIILLILSTVIVLFSLLTLSDLWISPSSQVLFVALAVYLVVLIFLIPYPIKGYKLPLSLVSVTLIIAAALVSYLGLMASSLSFLLIALISFLFLTICFLSSLKSKTGTDYPLLSAIISSLLIAGSSLVSPLSVQMYLILGAVFFPFIGLALSRNKEVAPIKLNSIKVDETLIIPDTAEAISKILTRFVPKEFLAILNKTNVSELALGDHVKRDMTIFFSDIRKFTSLSEGLTPEENFKFINSYLARIVPVINAHNGFVDKYVGDAIMALFPHESGADSAVMAAIEMQKKIVEYNGHRANCGYQPLSMGIGLHTGTLMLGVVGVEDRMQSTVISDAVNLASRLESITKVFNVSLAISEETFKNLQDPGAYMYRFIGKVRVKGKLEPVSVFEIYDGIEESAMERKMKANRFFEQGMMSYYQKEFTSAIYYFRKVLETLPEDGASAFYLDNCISKARGI
ncbi:hypothetical protein MASR2M78_32290 [Treponema sp.]